MLERVLFRQAPESPLVSGLQFKHVEKLPSHCFRRSGILSQFVAIDFRAVMQCLPPEWGVRFYPLSILHFYLPTGRFTYITSSLFGQRLYASASLRSALCCTGWHYGSRLGTPAGTSCIVQLNMRAVTPFSIRMFSRMYLCSLCSCHMLPCV